MIKSVFSINTRQVESGTEYEWNNINDFRSISSTVDKFFIVGKDMFNYPNNSRNVVIEFNHSGIPDDELRPEEFDAQQLAVLAALPPERQEQIRKDCPVAVIDMGSSTTLATFNRKNFVLSEYQKKELTRSVYEAAQRVYSDPENVKKYEAWKKERDAKDKQK